jgi:ribosomal protein L11 methyltransferase
VRGEGSAAVWRVRAEVRGADAAAAVLVALDEAAEAVSAFETAPGLWRVEAYPKSPALTPELAARLALAAAAAGGAVGDLSEARLADRDWLAENQLTFPPQRVGRFLIRGSHHRGPAPASALGIVVDAATAFGTGEHQSTRGCLLALDRLARRHSFRDPLDIGTGTGILAIAAAKALRRRVAAADIDAHAVAVARCNIARNGVAGLVRIYWAPGYRHPALRRRRHDLILSNILARPLAVMARDLANALAPGGRAVLSGLLRRQEAIVLGPHRGFGIALESRVVLDGWSTLILRAPPAPKTRTGARAPISKRVRPAFARRGAGGPAQAPPRRGGPEPARHRSASGSASAGSRYRPARGR